jgi:hypothetical protein
MRWAALLTHLLPTWCSALPWTQIAMALCSLKNKKIGRASVAHPCNLSYLGGWAWEDWGWKPALATSVRDPVSKITRAKWTGGVAQAIQHLLCKCKTPSSNPGPPNKKKNCFSVPNDMVVLVWVSTVVSQCWNRLPAIPQNLSLLLNDVWPHLKECL